MVYALDTNIISFLLRPSKNQNVVRQFMIETKQNGYVIPPLCYYEVLWYLLRKKADKQLQIFFKLYENSLARINMGETEFRKAAEIRADLERKGMPIGKDADIFIAAYCIVNTYTLVTNDTTDFGRIEGLSFVDWKTTL